MSRTPGSKEKRKNIRAVAPPASASRSATDTTESIQPATVRMSPPTPVAAGASVDEEAPKRKREPPKVHRLPEHLRRTDLVKVMVTKDERELLEAAAAHDRLTLSTWVRNTALAAAERLKIR